MRLRCYFCGKSVSSEVPEETVVRAILVCPECIEKGKIQVPEPRQCRCDAYEPSMAGFGVCLRCGGLRP